MTVRIGTSMAFDAICACQSLAGEQRNRHPVQSEVLAILHERTGDFSEGSLSFSTLCGILSHTDMDPETATLDDLIALFSDPAALDSAVRGKITNEFVASFTLPMLDWLREGWGARYVRYLEALRAADFEGLWQEKIRPVVEAERDRLTAVADDGNIEAMLAGVSRLKGVPVEGVRVYVSLMSYPVCFSLADNGFLQCVSEYDGAGLRTWFLPMIAHELMHGFASERTVSQYRAFMESTPYLHATHRGLIEDQHSGDEEEFVMAAEYDILCRAGVMTRDEIVRQSYGRYSGCVPLSLYLFDALNREAEPVADYDGWLAARFADGTFCPEAVPGAVLAMLPPVTDEEAFSAHLFTRFWQEAFPLREAQVSRTANRHAEIEAVTGGRFAPNGDPVVRFALGEKTVDADVRRETLVAGSLTVDALTFPTRGGAFGCAFSYQGSNLGPMPVEVDGEVYLRPYIFNLAYLLGEPLRVEVSFVAHTTRYLVTAVCPDEVRLDPVLDGGDDNAFVRRHGEAIIETVRQAMSVVRGTHE